MYEKVKKSRSYVGSNGIAYDPVGVWQHSRH